MGALSGGLFFFLGLVINVQSKRNMKQMKKLLRRAGAAKAKIRIKK